MKPDWKDAPDWAQWLAMDRDGGWLWFGDEPMPLPGLDIWVIRGWLALYAGHSGPSDDWQSTKERRPDESFENVQCPVCGYYCLGKGGIGCINKPALCGLVNDDETP